MCKDVVNANIYAKKIKRIIKDDKLQTLGISFSIPSGVATVGGGGFKHARPSIRRPRNCAGSGLARKYKNGLEAHIGDGVATRIKSGNTCTATGLHGGFQQPSSENGFENWVWTFECAPDLVIDLRLCLYFITFDYSIISLLLFGCMPFTFIFTQLAH